MIVEVIIMKSSSIDSIVLYDPSYHKLYHSYCRWVLYFYMIETINDSKRFIVLNDRRYQNEYSRALFFMMEVVIIKALPRTSQLNLIIKYSSMLPYICIDAAIIKARFSGPTVLYDQSYAKRLFQGSMPLYDNSFYKSLCSSI